MKSPCLFFLATVSALPQTPSPPPATLGSPRLVAGSLYAVEANLNGADGPNIAIYVTSEGVVLVDDRFDQDFEQAVERVKRVTDQPIRYVIKTHNHGNNTGAYWSKLPRVEGITSETARRHMIRMKIAGPPPLAFEDEASLFLGGKEIRLFQPGKSHTGGDVVVYFPAERAVYTCDLMAATDGVTNPSVDYASGGSLFSSPATLDKVLALDIDVVIPGAGFPVTKRAALVAHRDKVKAVSKRMLDWVGAGKSSDDIEKGLVSEFSFKPVNLHGLDGMIEESTQRR
jgi:glyoxylase-like metal-dependent hydrolase (beta-lactamase superfamily II)